MTNDLLRQAVSLIKAGDKVQGRQLLVQILKEDSKNDIAWLWLSQCVPEHERKMDCVKRALEINPNNTSAQKEFSRLKNLLTMNSEQKTSFPVQNKMGQSSSQSAPIKNEQKPLQPQQAKKTPNTLSALLAIAVILICLCVFAMSLFSDGDGNSDSSNSSTMAYIMCQDFIEQRLTAPATAKWPSSLDITIIPVSGKEDSYQVIGYVDAQNGFGALIRTSYVCEISYTGDDRWHLDSLYFDE